MGRSRQFVGGLTTLAAVVAAAGCWPVPGQNADRSAHNAFETAIAPASVADLGPAWETSLGRAVGAPVVSAGGVHAVTNTCDVATVAPGTGGIRWFQSCDPYNTVSHQASDVVVDGDRLSVGMWGIYDAVGPTPPQSVERVRRFEVASGAEITDANPPGTIPATVRQLQEIWTSPYYVYQYAPPYPVPFLTGGVPNATMNVRPTDGTAGGRFVATGGGTTPTLGRDAVFQSGSGPLALEPGQDAGTGPRVRAWSLTEIRETCSGGPTLTFECPRWVAPTDGVPTDPVLSSDQTTVYVGTDAGSVYALDAATGEVRWTARRVRPCPPNPPSTASRCSCPRSTAGSSPSMPRAAVRPRAHAAVVGVDRQPASPCSRRSPAGWSSRVRPTDRSTRSPPAVAEPEPPPACRPGRPRPAARSRVRPRCRAGSSTSAPATGAWSPTAEAPPKGERGRRIGEVGGVAGRLAQVAHRVRVVRRLRHVERDLPDRPGVTVAAVEAGGVERTEA